MDKAALMRWVEVQGSPKIYQLKIGFALLFIFQILHNLHLLQIAPLTQYIEVAEVVGAERKLDQMVVMGAVLVAEVAAVEETLEIQAVQVVQVVQDKLLIQIHLTA